VDHWADVAKIVNERMAERSITQQELAALSGVSVATVRKIQSGVSQQRTRAVLAGISRALDFAEDHLWRVSRGESPAGDSEGEVSALRAEVSQLTRRVEVLETRLATPNGM
jgi:transcriptional regulator with XRE-family HTH domain